MKKLLSFFALMLLAKTNFAQNLVSNGNFEAMNVCPSAYNQVTACATWSPAPNNINSNFSTEYLNACNSGLFNVPNSTWGPQAAKSGNGYMATCMMAPAVAVDYRENIFTTLTTSLIPGNSYSVSMYVSHTDNSKNSTNRMGLKFSKVPSFPINNIAHISTTVVITDDINWVLVSGTFVADSAYKYIAVGNFYTDANTTVSVSCSGCAFNQFGYFIEDVSVTLLNPNSSFVSSSQSVCVGSPISFTNTSTNANSYLWNFGDGATSTSTNPTHTYTNNAVYTVTLTATTGTISSTSTQTITVNPNPTITPSSSPQQICSGQTSTISVAGANTYTWNTGSNSTNIYVSPTVTTSYTVIGTDNFGCTGTSVITINVHNASPAAPSAINGPNIICSNASGTYSVSPVSGATSYSWALPAGWSGASVTNSINATSGAVGGIISVYAINACGSSPTQTLLVNLNASPTVAISSSTNNICSGTSITLQASGANTYTWSSGATTVSMIITPTVSTAYYVNATDVNGCYGSSNIFINVFQPPIITVATGTLCEDAVSPQSTTLTANGAVSYTWSTGSNNSSIIITPMVTTNYTVSGTSANGCTNSIVVTEYVSACTGIKELVNDHLAVVYPNPSHGEFNVEVKNNSLLKVYDVLGKEIFSKTLETGINRVELQNIKTGMYFIKIVDHSGEKKGKIIIN